MMQKKKTRKQGKYNAIILRWRSKKIIIIKMRQFLKQVKLEIYAVTEKIMKRLKSRSKSCLVLIDIINPGIAILILASS